MNLQEISSIFGKTRIMNLKNLRSSIKIAKALDKQGSFKASDLLFEKLVRAFPLLKKYSDMYFYENDWP